MLSILSRAAATIAEGEVLQLQTQNDLSTTEDWGICRSIQGKTAALFAAACEVGAVIAGRPPREQEALAAFGMNLGIAFQLVDDALDYAANQATLGKTVGDDFREGKVTLPVLAAYHAGDETERGFWRRAIEDGAQDEGDLERALHLMAERGAIEATLTRAHGFATAARAALAVFPDSPARCILADVADFTVSRAR